MVTEFVAPVPRSERADTIRRFGGFRTLGEMLGWLHTLPGRVEGEPDAAVNRPGGGWHHLGDGSPADELASAREWMERAAGTGGGARGSVYRRLHDALDRLDDGHGLPVALIHPDFVLANVVASAEQGMVLVDWTGSGRGPRLWSLAFLLYSAGVTNLGPDDRVVEGYRHHVQPTDDELVRLGAVIAARPVVLDIWRIGVGRMAMSEAADRIDRWWEKADSIADRARTAFASS